MTFAIQFQRIELNDDIARELTFAVEKTIHTMFSVKPKAGQWTVQHRNSVAGDISGMISFIQDRLEATMVVCFPKDLATELMSQLVRRPLTEVDSLVASGVGELTNVTFGVLKARLNENGYSFKATIPTVVTGNSHVIGAVASSSPTLILPFEINGKRFNVLLTINRE